MFLLLMQCCSRYAPGLVLGSLVEDSDGGLQGHNFDTVATSKKIFLVLEKVKSKEEVWNLFEYPF